MHAPDPGTCRLSLRGTWQIHLSDPSRFAELDDLRLFYIYTTDP